MPISVPNNDPFYSKYRQRCMNYVRSLMAMRPDCHFGPAEQVSVFLCYGNLIIFMYFNAELLMVTL